MPNTGIAPPDFSTEVGKFRLLANDLNYTEPNVPNGEGDYELFSDDEIEAYLEQSSNLYRAVGLAYISLANSAARQAESIRDFDLQIDSRQKAEQLRLQAQWYFGEADRIDVLGEDGYTIVRTGRRWTADELAEINWADVDYSEFIV